MKLDVHEDDLPGIGRRYVVQGDDGGVLTIVLHNSGRRELYLFPRHGDQPVTVAMDDHQARSRQQCSVEITHHRSRSRRSRR